jgi:hypothetical protein
MLPLLTPAPRVLRSLRLHALQQGTAVAMRAYMYSCTQYKHLYSYRTTL